MKIIIFEDNCYNNFYPLSMTRPVWDLRMGCFTLRERLENFIEKEKLSSREEVSYSSRHYFEDFYEESSGIRINQPFLGDINDTTVFINASVLPAPGLLKMGKNKLYKKNGTPLLLISQNSILREELIKYSSLLEFFDVQTIFPAVEIDDITALEYIWDLVDLNPGIITEDIKYIDIKTGSKNNKSVTFIGDKNLLYIDDGVRIDPFVCIDLTNGPVVVRKGTVIDSFSRIEGPCYIGRDCRILGARLRGGCSIGDSCRIGGEVETSIFHAYSNKYHDGFIGHSYIGEWVNLGALTTNSDLKNNYTQVKVYIPNKRINTDKMKIGCYIGDFTKTSIGTLIMTGCSIGPGCMVVHSGGLTPPHIPAFAWYMNDVLSDSTRMQSFIKTCATITARRGVELTGSYALLLEHIYTISSDERKREIERWKRILR